MSLHVRLRKQRVSVTLIAALVMSFPVSSVFAQGFAPGPASAGKPRVSVEKDDNTKQTVIRTESELTTKVTVDAPPSAACTASIEIDFFQRNTLAAVESIIDNQSCGASSGEVVLAVTTRNDAGENSTQEFTNAWQRSDAKPLKLKAEYPIGNNVDLVRVRARHITCTCTAAPAQ